VPLNASFPAWRNSSIRARIVSTSSAARGRSAIASIPVEVIGYELHYIAARSWRRRRSGNVIRTRWGFVCRFRSSGVKC